PFGTSDALVFPLRSRSIVVFLLPKAARKAKGNSSPSKGWDARSDTAASISTAFMCYLYQMDWCVRAQKVVVASWLASLHQNNRYQFLESSMNATLRQPHNPSSN